MSSISKDANRAIAQKKQQRLTEFQRDPFGVWRHRYTDKHAVHPGSMGNALGRFK